MNHTLWTAAGARVLATMFVVAGLAACGDRISNTHSKAAPANPADPSAVVIGTATEQPTGDPPGTTPVAGGTDELSKKAETQKMPMEGQDSSHLSESKNDSQRTGGSDQQTQRRGQ